MTRLQGINGTMILMRLNLSKGFSLDFRLQFSRLHKKSLIGEVINDLK